MSKSKKSDFSIPKVLSSSLTGFMSGSMDDLDATSLFLSTLGLDISRNFTPILIEMERILESGLGRQGRNDLIVFIHRLDSIYTDRKGFIYHQIVEGKELYPMLFELIYSDRVYFSNKYSDPLINQFNSDEFLKERKLQRSKEPNQEKKESIFIVALASGLFFFFLFDILDISSKKVGFMCGFLLPYWIILLFKIPSDLIKKD